MMSLEDELKSWDGKSSSEIDAIYRRHHKDKLFISEIIELSQQIDFQIGATWLLKRYCESGKKLDATDTSLIFNQLPNFEHWGAKLHILQCLSFMSISKAHKKDVEIFLRKCLISPNKFVRAWAYNGFYEIALQYREYEEEAKSFFNLAMRDEAPSVKARIRKIMKKGF